MVARAPRRFRDREEPTRRGGLLASRVAALRQPARSAGAGVLAGRVGAMREHPAVGFGRSMAGMGTAAGPISRITGDVFARLAERGIYRDARGNWQIAGMERSDPSIAIRDSAIAAMDPSGAWGRLVGQTEPDLSTGGPALADRVAAIPAATSARGNATATEPTVVRETRTERTPPTITVGGAPQTPGIRPGITPSGNPTPVVTSGPNAGLNNATMISPTGATRRPVPDPVEIAGGQHRPADTVATAGLTPATPGRVGQQAAPSGPMGTAGQAEPSGAAALREVIRSGEVPRSTINPSLNAPPPAPLAFASSGLPQATHPAGREPTTQEGRVGTGTGGQVIGGLNGLPGPRQPQNPATAGLAGAPPSAPGRVGQTAAPSGPMGTAGQPATPATPGPATTPTVAPGSLPGSTTPSRPGQLPPGFGTGTPSYGTGDLSTLGDRIRASVGQQTGPSAAPGATAGLSGLGDRIRASVARATGDIGVSVPGQGVSGLGGMASGIMESVRQQLARNQMESQLGPAMAAPASEGIAPAGPQTAVSPMASGGAPQFAPLSQPLAAPAPSDGSLGAPQGTVPIGQITGGMSWDQINQWDDEIMAVAGKYPGVDPAMVKAMLIVESGGDPNAAGAGGAIGLMQIKPGDWQAGMPAGIDLYTPQGQIEGAFAILSGAHPQAVGNTPMERFLNSYYPIPAGMNVAGESGHTQNMYLADMEMYMGIIHGAAPGGGQPTDQRTTYPTVTETSQGPVGEQAPAQGPWNPDGTLSEAGLAALGVTPAPVESTVPGEMFPGSTRPIDHDAGIPMVRDAQGNLVPADAGAAPTTVISPPTGGQGTGPVALNPNYVPSGNVGSVGGPPNTQPQAAFTPENLAYLEGMIPGSSGTVLADPYGFGSDSGCPGCYDNYYGWDPNRHTGLDVATNPSVQESYVGLTGGQVVCVGGATGAMPSNATGGCGAYPDYEHGGLDANASGNITILDDFGALVTYGHTSVSNVQLGQEVAPGQALGLTGSQTGPDGHHVHLEVSLPIGPSGEYVLVDPNVYFNGGYCDQGFCPTY